MRRLKEMTNAEIADLFREVAAVYTIRGVEAFRTQAYLSAAVSIEQFPTPLKEMWQAGQLEEVPGIGEKFCKYLDELFRTGRIKHFDKVLATEPAGMYPLLEVPGIGPKTAVKLATLFHLNDPKTAVQKIARAAQKGEIEKVSGFSKISQQKILRAIEQFLQPKEHRLLLSEAEQISEDVLSYLRQSPATLDAEALGSLRRRAPTIGDIDIAVKTKDPEAVQQHILQFPRLQKLISSGSKMVIFVHSTGWQVDIKTQTPDRWGSMLQHYTGSKLHNIHLRTYANSMGLSLSENGIKKGKKTAKYTDEASFYRALGLSYIPPELREDHGEIEAARKDRIPDLVELKDIKGDLHVHTNLPFPTSHDLGVSSIEELLGQAQELKYEFIGFSDHNPKQELSASERLRVVRERNELIDREVEKFHQKNPGHLPLVYKGLEVDILPGGKLALEDEALELLDYAIVSIHSQFHPRAEDGESVREHNTQRILAALAHPKAKIFGHPTARKLPHREEIECDWDEVFRFAAAHHKYLEINASPDRLDLPSPLVQQALTFGVRFVIDTDAHSVNGLTLMRYGVWTARKGWAAQKDIANAHPEMTWD